MSNADADKKRGPEGVTRLLHEWSEGDHDALNRVLPMIYDQLRAVARANFSGERINALQTTELVDMVYLKLAKGSNARFKSREQFFWYASQMMRHILVDQARSRLSQKHGGGMVDSLDKDSEVQVSSGQELDYPTLIALDNALENLEALNPEQCRIIELRYFAGMTIEETAKVMDVAPATVKRHWGAAKRWLFLELNRK